jgi:hypothetical protein
LTYSNHSLESYEGAFGITPSAPAGNDINDFELNEMNGFRFGYMSDPVSPTGTPAWQQATATDTSTGQVTADISGQGDTASFNNASITLEDGAQATITGNNDTLITGRSASVNITGTGETINGSNASVAFGANSSGNVTGSGDTLSLASGDAVGIGGGGNTIDMASGANVWIAGSAGNNDIVNASGGGINLLAGSAASIFGSNDSVSLGDGSNAYVAGGGNTIGMGAGANVWIGGTNGNSDTVNASGDGVNLLAGSAANIFGSGDSISLGDASNAYVAGGANTINMGAGDTISIGGTNGNSDTVNASGDQIVTQDNVSFNLVGSGDTIHVGGNSYLGLIAGDQNEGVYANGDQIVTQDNVSFNLVGSGDTIHVGGNSYLGLIVGDQNESVYASNDHIVAQNNVGMTIFGAGDVVDSSNNTIGLQGSGSSITLNGTGNTIHLDSSGETLTETSPGETGNHITIPDDVGSVEYINFADGVSEQSTMQQGGVINLSGYDPTNAQDGYHFSADFGADGYETFERDTYDGGGIVNTTWNADGSGMQTGTDSAAGADWSSFSDSFNSYDQLTSERIYYPDGTRSLTQFATGASNDPEYTTYYNSAGAAETLPGWGYDPYDAAYTADIGGYYFSDAGDEGFGDPIVLSLDGTPVQTTPVRGSDVFFDRTNSGEPVQTAWVTEGEALLVYDPDRAGTPTSESDLVAGFDQLRALDANSDGVLDGRDPAWSSLGAWINTNAATKGEPVVPLDQLGITSIDLNAVADGTNNFGNTILADSTFARADGRLGQIAAVDLAFNPAGTGAAGAGFVALPHH